MILAEIESKKLPKNAAQLINQTSKKFEYYTPLHLVTAARLTMGRIDLDPASSNLANHRIGAENYYTEADDGLAQRWAGRVWMNHPFSREGNPLWVNKLVGGFLYGEISQACCITYACTSEKWFQPLMSFPQCYLQPQTNYLLPNGKLKKGVTKGSAITYMGSNLTGFYQHFRDFGKVVVPFNG